MKYKIDDLPEIIEELNKDYSFRRICELIGCSEYMLLHYRKRNFPFPVEIAKNVQEAFKIKLFY